MGVAGLPQCAQAQLVAGVASCSQFGGSQLVGNPTITAGAVYVFSGDGQKTAPYLGADYSTIGMHSGPNLIVSGTKITGNYPLDWTNNIRPNGGVKFFVKRNLAFDFNVGWDKDLDSNSSDINTFDIRFGFSYVF